MPMPPLPEPAGEFMGALVESGYLMQAVAMVEIVTGIMLLINRFQPLALVILFPVLLNAFWFHLFLDLQELEELLCTAMNQFLFFC